VVAEACIETNDVSDHDRRVLARSSAKFASEVFQFTLTCSHGPIFICFVCVTGSSVAPKHPHLQSKSSATVQQQFSPPNPSINRLHFAPQVGSVGKSVGAICVANSLNTRTGRVM